MKPLMKQKVTAHVALYNADGSIKKDKRGIPITETVVSKARVQFKAQLVRDAKGQEHQVNLEIDLPTLFNPDVGTRVDYQMIDGRTSSGTIRAKEEATNLAASIVYYRTVFVDG